MQRFCSLFTIAALAVLCLSTVASAQPRGGFGGPGGRFGFGGGLMGLVRIEAVQKEIGAEADQVAAIQKYGEEQRAQRAGNQGGQRPNFQNMSAEDREKLAAQMEKQTAAANAKLAEILKPQQIARIEEISLQVRGSSALADPKVAEKLKLSDEQKAKLKEVTAANMKAMQSQMQELGQGGNREGLREKMQELRKQAQEKVLAVLSTEQQAAFEKLKGKAFQMPEPPAGGQGGGRQRRGGAGAAAPNRAA
jgi:Spy/CpxP family protein refolding chaperone